MTQETKHLYEFGEFQLDTAERLLRRFDEVVPLKSKVFDMLVLLVENAGHLLEKDWLMQQLWPDSFVEEVNLNVNISTIRKALRETPTQPRYIETIPKRGYRFIAKVTKTSFEDNIPTVVLPPQNEAAALAQIQQTAAAKPLNYVTNPLPDIESIVGDDAKVDRGETAINKPEKPQRLSAQKMALWTLLFLVLASAATYLFWAAKFKDKNSQVPALRTIAVLPFRTLTGSEDDNALGLGMADALITRLGSLKDVTVRPTGVVLKYSNGDQNPIEAGKALSVDAVLTGFVQKDGKNIRISTQMTRVADGRTLWADKFDDFFTNVFAVQDSISEKMIVALSLHLTGSEKQLITKRYTENTEAYGLYLQGLYYHHKLNSKKALEFYNAAIAKDPEYPLPYAQIEGIYLGYANAGINRQFYLDKAREAVNKALSLAPNLSEANEALGDLKYAVDWDFAASEKAYERALELNPGNESARFSYALLLSRLGRHDEAIKEIEFAHQLDPISVYINAQYIDILVNAGRIEQAIEQAKKALELDSDAVVTHYYLAKAYAAKSMYVEAIAELQKNADRQESKRLKLYSAYVYARSGNKIKAEKIIEECQQDPQINPSMWKLTNLSMAYAALGEKDKAFEMLEKAVQEKVVSALNMKVEPEFQPLRSDPRFADLIKRMGLPE
jgi:DNA-binding winged helix-turn-helix (wHTH) protein/TolB-like protein/tetratricopeptide (TPR) repeat protein